MYLIDVKDSYWFAKVEWENVYDKNLCKINSIGIDKPCINIAKIEILFEKYRMALKREKNAIEVQKDDAIKRKIIFFWFHAKNVQ